MKKISSIISRIIRKQAVGIIYNCPKTDQSFISTNILKKHNCINISGKHAYTSHMLLWRLGSILDVRDLSFNMLPALLEDKMVCISSADMFKKSFSSVLENFYKHKIPILLLMNGNTNMQDFRKLPCYNRVLTIEQDFKNL